MDFGSLRKKVNLSTVTYCCERPSYNKNTMKSLFSLCLFVLLSSTISFAQVKTEPNILFNQGPTIDCVDCYVNVTFYIDFDGSAKVVDTDSKNPELVQFVLKKFEKIHVDPKNYFVGKTMRYRFNFKLDPTEAS